MRIALLLLTTTVAMTLPSRAHAQLVYQFADSNGVAMSSFNVAVGDTVSIRVYLLDTVAGAPTLNANGGLGSSAVRVSYTNPTVANIPNLATGAVPAVPPWQFGTNNGSVPNASAVINDGTISAGVLPTIDRILLGTFTFTGNNGGTSNLTAADPNPGNNFDTTYFSTGVGIDTQISSANVMIIVVPEPITLCILLTGGLIVGSVKRRRKARSTDNIVL